VKDFKLDKSAFKAQSFEEAARDSLFPKHLSIADRLRLAFHLTCTIYGLEKGDPLKIDTSVFSARKL
jgi:hypothetical protein